MNNLNKGIATLYILCYEMEVASLPEQKDQRKAIRDDKSAVVPINLIIKKIPKWFYQCYRLPCSFKIFINLFAFLYAVKSNFKEICEEMFFSSFFFRKMLLSALLRFNYPEKLSGHPIFLQLDFNSSCKDLIFSSGS